MDISKRLKIAIIGLILFTFFVTGEALAGTSLVSVKWLAKNLNKSNMVILDVGAFTHYEKTHIPGAVKAFGPWMTMSEDFVGFMMPEVTGLVKMIKGYGVNNKSLVIIYDEGITADDTAKSARALWTLHALGHDNVAILDGGFAGWDQMEKPVSNKPATPDAGNFTGKLVTSKVATLAEVEKKTHNSKVVFVDNRIVDHFFGKEKNSEVDRFGHIPGARLWPESYMSDAGINLSPSYLKSVKVLGKMAAGVGIPADKNTEIITYSNHGLTAAMGYFVLHDMLGYNNVKVFDGSMLEYAAAQKAPLDRHNWGYISR